METNLFDRYIPPMVSAFAFCAFNIRKPYNFWSEQVNKNQSHEMILLYICSFCRVNWIDSVNQAAILKFKKLTHEVKIITYVPIIAPTPQNLMIWNRKPIVSPMAGKNSILGERKGWKRKKLKLIKAKRVKKTFKQIKSSTAADTAADEIWTKHILINEVSNVSITL